MDPFSTSFDYTSGLTSDPAFLEFKNENRKLLEQRSAAQRRIESLKREYDFISALEPHDVNFIMNKKKEHAAIVVQRTWRKVKQQREYKRAQRGEYKPEVDYEKTPQDIQRIQENQDFKEQTQMHVRKAFPDNFYTKPIDEDTKKSL